MDCISLKSTIFIFTVFWLIVPLLTGPMAVLDSNPVTVKVKSGDQAILPCQGKNWANEEVVWLDKELTMLSTNNGTTFDPRFKVEVGKDKRNFIIPNVQPMDSGAYHCMLQLFPPQVKVVTLIVTVPPDINKTLMQERYMFMTGQNFSITCSASGNPEPKIRWLSYKTSTDSMTEVEGIASTNQILSLSNLQATDAGIYRCEASNEAGTDKYEILLQHVYKPVLTSANTNLVVKKGSRAVLQCEIESSPSASIGWQRNQTMLKTTWKYKVEMYAESETKKIAELTIFQTENTDNGDYTCVASNQHGRTNLRFIIAVEESTAVRSSSSSTSKQTSAVVTSTTVTEDYITINIQQTERVTLGGPKTEASRNAAYTRSCNSTYIFIVFSLLLSSILAL